MNTAVTIQPDGELTVSNDEIGLSFLQSQVDGLIQPVLNMTGVDAEGYVNEEGLLIGMERNLVAERYFGYGPLVGPCVIVGPLDEEGNSTPIRPEVLRLFVGAALFESITG